MSTGPIGTETRGNAREINMLGFRFIKAEPTQFVIQYRNGRPHREGAGLSFWYFAPSTSIVVVPTASVNEPFIFPEVTADFQEVTVQGQITYRVAEPRRTATLLNFTIGPKRTYVSEDPQKLLATPDRSSASGDARRGAKAAAQGRSGLGRSSGRPGRSRIAGPPDNRGARSGAARPVTARSETEAGNRQGTRSRGA